jgi:hypothetical protein
MSQQGPEGKYIAKVHRQLDKFKNKQIYRMSNTNIYIGGIPDQYYEGPSGILWVEYKFLKTLPNVLDLTNPKKKLLSALQTKWLRRATNNNVNTAVIVGLENGEGIWLRNLSWEILHPKSTLAPKTPIKIAENILRVIA